MAVKRYKPTTPGRRRMSVIVYKKELTASKPYKPLLRVAKKKAGRNNQGKLTVRHHGGGMKNKYRVIDTKRYEKLNIPATVQTIEYDPNRSAFISLLLYADGERRYIITPAGLKVGDKIICKEKAKVKPGNSMRIRYIPTGFAIYDLELKINKGAEAIRSAGSSGKLVSLDSELAQVMMPSGEVRYVPKDCYASIGVVSNADHSNVMIGKAGRRRRMGWRPTVRGSAMNPVDHPHGGGKGRCPIGLPQPRTPWGKPALGVHTRHRHETDYLIAKSRRKK